MSNYIKSCHDCQQLRGPRSTDDLKCPLQPLKIPEKFNERVHADLMRPLRSITSNKYILVMSDAFTKWIELIPLPNKSAEEVAKAVYENWICRNSPMDTLITDNGKEFRNRVMEELCKNHGIKHRYTSPYHPQTNAQCEHQNLTILAYLKTFVDDTTLNWESKLQPCQYSYNSQIHQSTRNSPYFARHFQSPTVPFKQLTTPVPKYSETWANEALLTQQNVWREINENLNKASDNQKAQHNKRINDRTLQAGDLVCIIDYKPKIGKNIKLVKRWTGPFVITKMISDTNALIRRKPTGKEEIVHVQRLKIYHSLPTDYTTGHLNRDGETPHIPGANSNTGESTNDIREPAQPPAIRHELPDIPEESESKDEPTPQNRTQLKAQNSTDHVLSDSLRRNSTTSEAWREGVAQASTPLEQTLENSEEEEEVFNPLRQRQKRKPTGNETKPNWTPKRRVCEQCLKDQIFSDSEAPESENTDDDDDDNDEANPWIDVRRRRKANIVWSTRDIMCKRGHFQGRKHPLTTTADDTIVVPTRRTRSQGPVTPDNLMPPTRPLEYKSYTKRK